MLDPTCPDTRLLDEFQRDLPLVSRPFAAMGEVIGLSEAAISASSSRWMR